MSSNDLLDNFKTVRQFSKPTFGPLQMLALYITTGLFLFSWIFAFQHVLSFGFAPREIYLPIQMLFGFFGLLTVWIVRWMKRRVWVGLFALFLIAWMLGFVWMSGVGFSLSVSFLGVNLGPLVLFGIHVGYNRDVFQELFRSFRASDEETERQFEDRVQVFMAKYAAKSETQLQELLAQGLMPEAEEAIRRLTTKGQTETPSGPTVWWFVLLLKNPDPDNAGIPEVEKAEEQQGGDQHNKNPHIVQKGKDTQKQDEHFQYGQGVADIHGPNKIPRLLFEFMWTNRTSFVHDRST